MKWICCWLIATPIWAQMSFEELKVKVFETTDHHKTQAEIRDQGVDFDINLDTLRRLKKERFPDWAIDTLVIMDVEQFHEPYEREPDYGPSLSYSRPYRLNPSPWGYWYEPWGYWDPWFALGYSYLNPWSSWYYPYWFNGYGYYDGSYYGPRVRYLPGNRLSPRGYANRHEARYRGRAQPRGSKETAQRSSSRSSRSATRSNNSSRSNGGRVTTRGYKRD